MSRLDSSRRIEHVYRISSLQSKRYRSYSRFCIASMPGFEPLSHDLKLSILPLSYQATGWHQGIFPWFCSKSLNSRFHSLAIGQLICMMQYHVCPLIIRVVSSLSNVAWFQKYEYMIGISPIDIAPFIRLGNYGIPWCNQYKSGIQVSFTYIMQSPELE